MIVLQYLKKRLKPIPASFLHLTSPVIDQHFCPPSVVRVQFVLPLLRQKLTVAARSLFPMEDELVGRKGKRQKEEEEGGCLFQGKERERKPRVRGQRRKKAGEKKSLSSSCTIATLLAVYEHHVARSHPSRMRHKGLPPYAQEEIPFSFGGVYVQLSFLMALFQFEKHY